MPDTNKFQAVTTADGVTWKPWTDGHAIGFEITDPTGNLPAEYVILNPSDGSDDQQPNVFVYHGQSPDLADRSEEPVCYVDVFEVPPGNGEDWTDVWTTDGEGPFAALVTRNPDDSLATVRMPWQAVNELIAALLVDEGTSVEWAGVAAQVRAHTDAEPFLVQPDERGLYLMDAEGWAWTEHRVPAVS